MEPTAALLAGLVAGLAIAMQVGAVSLLLIETAVTRGPRVGVAAGMAVASVDFAFAVVAVLTGGAAGAALRSNETEIRVAAGLVLAAIAGHGLLGLLRGGGGSGRAAPPQGAQHATADEPPQASSARTYFARFLAITAVNPLTIASFAAIALALSLDGPLSAAAFAIGVGAASAAWHLVLTAAAGHAGRWMTPRVRRALGIAGRVAVLAIAAKLVLG